LFFKHFQPVFRRSIISDMVSPKSPFHFDGFHHVRHRI